MCMKVFFPKHIDFLKHLIITYVKTVHIDRLRNDLKMQVRHLRKVLLIMFCAVTACHFAILTITVHTYTYCSEWLLGYLKMKMLISKTINHHSFLTRMSFSQKQRFYTRTFLFRCVHHKSSNNSNQPLPP